MGIEVDVSTSGFFKFPNFLDMMARLFHIRSIFGRKVEIYKNCFSIFRKIDEISAEDEIREAFKVFDSVSRDSTPWTAAKNVILQTSFRMEMDSSTVKSWAMWWTIWDYKWTRMKLRWLSDEKWQIPMIFLCRVLNVSVVIYLKKGLVSGINRRDWYRRGRTNKLWGILQHDELKVTKRKQIFYSDIKYTQHQHTTFQGLKGR